MITADLRRALRTAATAAGLGNPDPGLRPGGLPGQYAASVALATPDPKTAAKEIAAHLRREPWIATVEITGPGYLCVTVTPDTLAALPERIANAGLACATSDALAATEVPAPPPGDPLTAATWEAARAALAAQVTARLAAAAGATISQDEAPERSSLTPPAPPPSSGAPHRPASRDAPVAAAVAFAGADAVTFTLARAIPGKPLRVDQEEIARHVPGNPAYAVRYAHARAAAVFSRGGDPPYPPVSWRTGPMAEGAIVSDPSARTIADWDSSAGTIARRGPSAEAVGYAGDGVSPGELILLDALSWLPERVAMAARRGRPDEFARYLTDLAGVTIDALTARPDYPGRAGPPGSDKLALAKAARTALAAGLGLLGVGAPDRL